MPLVLQVSLDALPGMEGESFVSSFCAKMKSKWCSEKSRGELLDGSFQKPDAENMKV